MNNDISKEKEYLTHLRNQVYKILPLYEEEDINTFLHVNSTINRLKGLEEVFTDLKQRREYIDLMSTLEFLYDECLLIELEQNHETIKREVFKCCNLIESMKVGE